MTAGEHWRRDAFAFYDFLALPRAGLDGPPALDGRTGAVMSHDTRTEAQTLVVELPAGWRREADGRDAALELFVLRGDVALERERVAGGGYVHVPQGCGGGELRSEAGALALVFWNPNQPSFPPPYTENTVRRLWDVPWRPSLEDGAHGIMHKPLRWPDPMGDGFDGGPGGFLRILYIAPGIDAPFEHVHAECWEEIIFLGGDCLLADEGVMGLGSVVSHPQEWWHGPFASRGGCLLLNQTDAPMGFPWPARDYPHQREVCDAYLDHTAWDEPSRHTPWEAVDERVRGFQADPAFAAWAASPAAAEFGDRVGRDVAASFRASWRRGA